MLFWFSYQDDIKCLDCIRRSVIEQRRLWSLWKWRQCCINIQYFDFLNPASVFLYIFLYLIIFICNICGVTNRKVRLTFRKGNVKCYLIEWDSSWVSKINGKQNASCEVLFQERCFYNEFNICHFQFRMAGMEKGWNLQRTGQRFQHFSIWISFPVSSTESRFSNSKQQN